MSTAVALRLTLLTRRGCCLCGEMRAVIEKVAKKVPFVLDEVDVDGDAHLAGMYGKELPVLLVNGRKAFKYRVSEEALRHRLERELGGG